MREFIQPPRVNVGTVPDTWGARLSTPGILRGLKLMRGCLDRASMGNALDNPEPVAARQAVPLANMRSLGRNRVFVCCSNPDCHHNAEIDVSGLPDDVTFGDLQPRMLCTVCNHRGADVSPSWLHHG